MTARLKNIRVLVVDDVLDNQILLKHFLVRNGALVELASNGLEAVEKALNQSYDLILMDIQMPIMDGYQAFALLKSRDYRKPVIALTAHALLEERGRTEAAGFAGHLTKPLNIEELLKKAAMLTQKSAPAYPEETGSPGL